jgi:hypothetical protein
VPVRKRRTLLSSRMIFRNTFGCFHEGCTDNLFQLHTQKFHYVGVFVWYADGKCYFSVDT